MKNIFITLIFFSVSLNMAFGQSWSDDNDYKRLSLNLFGGPNLFHGDIDGQIGLTGTVGFEMAISSSVNLEGIFSYGLLEGDEPKVGTFFTNQYYQYAGRMNLLPLNILHMESFNHFVNPYLFIGGGRTVSNITNANFSLEGGYESQNYKGTDLFLQTGAGVRVYLTEHFDVHLRWNYNFVMTDLLDGLDPEVLNDLHDDRFQSFNIGVSYKFGKSKTQHLNWKAKGKKIGKRKNIYPQIEPAPESAKNSVVEKPVIEEEAIKSAPAPVVEDTPITEEEYEEKIKFDPKTKVEPVHNLSGRQGDDLYYIIGGSFAVKVNAEEFENQLNKNGYQSFIVTNPAGTLHRVVLESNNDPSETFNALSKYREIHDPDTWMIINEIE